MPIQILKEFQGNYVRNCWEYIRLQPQTVGARSPVGPRAARPDEAGNTAPGRPWGTSDYDSETPAASPATTSRRDKPR